MAKEFTDIHAVIGQVAQDYQYKTVYMPDWISSFWEKLNQFIARCLTWLISKLMKLFAGFGIHANGAGDSSKLRIIIFLGSLLFVAIALVIWQQKRRSKQNWAGKSNADFGKLVGQPRTSLEWRRQAADFKEKGLYREACRSLHRACLQILDESKFIAFSPARSNYEYMRTLNNLPQMTDIHLRQNLNKTFQTFSNSIDGIYFGNRPAGEAEFELCLKWLQEIQDCLVEKQA